MCLLNKNWAKDIVVCIDMRKVACRVLDYATLYMLHSMRQFGCQDSSKTDVKDDGVNNIQIYLLCTKFKWFPIVYISIDWKSKYTPLIKMLLI